MTKQTRQQTIIISHVAECVREIAPTSVVDLDNALVDLVDLWARTAPSICLSLPPAIEGEDVGAKDPHWLACYRLRDAAYKHPIVQAELERVREVTP